MSRTRIIAVLFLGISLAWWVSTEVKSQAAPAPGAGAGATANVPTVGLLEAARTGNAAMVKLHIEAGNKLDLVDDQGMTALDYAAKNDDIKMYQMLWATGAFKQHATNFKFLAAHHLVDVDKMIATAAPEALALVKVEGDTVTRLEKHATLLPGNEKTMGRIRDLSRQIGGLAADEQEKVLGKVEEIWGLPRVRFHDTQPGQTGFGRSEGQDVNLLIQAAARQAPLLKQYLVEFKGNPFMEEIVILAARIALTMEPAPAKKK